MASEREPQEYVFLESGTWTRPEGATWVRVEMRGGDGGPASSREPGMPGSESNMLMRAEWLPWSVAVNVGGSAAASGADAIASGDGWVRVTAFFGGRP